MWYRIIWQSINETVFLIPLWTFIHTVKTIGWHANHCVWHFSDPQQCHIIRCALSYIVPCVVKVIWNASSLSHPVQWNWVLPWENPERIPRNDGLWRLVVLGTIHIWCLQRFKLFWPPLPLCRQNVYYSCPQIWGISQLPLPCGRPILMAPFSYFVRDVRPCGPRLDF